MSPEWIERAWWAAGVPTAWAPTWRCKPRKTATRGCTVSTRLQPSPGAGSRRWRLVYGFGIVGIQLGCIIVRYRVCSCERGSRLLWEGECAPRWAAIKSSVVSRVNDASVVGGNSYSSLLTKPSGSLLGQWWQRARRRRARARRQLRWSVVRRHDG